MDRKVPDNGTNLTKVNQKWTRFKTGHYFPTEGRGAFEGTLECVLIGRFEDSEMSTFYMSPAIIGTKQFYQDLLDCGVDNIEVKPVVIEDRKFKRVFDNYVVLNFIGRIACADMDSSEYGHIGEDMNVIDKLVLQREKVQDRHLFLVDEDTDCIVVSENVYKTLNEKGYTDIYFEEVVLI
jgi:hypothetical protein